MSTNPREPSTRKRPTTDRVQIHKRDPDTWSPEAQLQFVDDALIVLTQAFCHHGHPLIAPGNATFGGFPGVRLHVEAAGRTHEVTLSPIHGHHDRLGGDGIRDGAACVVRCPTCAEELESYAPCSCKGGTLRTIHLTPDLDPSEVAAVCDIWGCQRSRVVDGFDLLSEFVEMEIGAE